MKKEQVQVGKVYAAKVSGSVVPVRIKEEKWAGDKHVGWVGTNVRTNKTVRIKSAQRLRNEVGPTPADDGQAGTPASEGTPAAEGTQAGTSPNGAKKGGKAKAAPKTEAKPAKTAKEPKTAKPAKPKRVSAIDAAAQVLAEAGKPMKAQEMVDAMEAQGLWRSPGGKTPAASVYASIIREIAAKKKESRFRKTDRGTFEATAHAASAGKEG